MKKILIVFVMLAGLLTGCGKVDPKALAYEQLDALKPCVLDTIVYQSVDVGVACAVEAVQGELSEQLVDVLEIYLVELPIELELILIDLFNVESVREVAVIVVEYIRIELEQYTFTLPGLAYAQTSPSDPPGELKDVADIKDLLSPEMIALLLIPVTMVLTWLAKAYVPAIEGVVTILVNAAMNSVAIGLTMYLAGGATVGYIVLFTLIKFVADQSTYWFVVKPEKARAKELARAV
jgi:hypothetical protein